MRVIRQIGVGQSYKNAMFYRLGQEVFDGAEIINIIEMDDRYDVAILHYNKVKVWKSFSKSMGISVEYSLNYEND